MTALSFTFVALIAGSLTKPGGTATAPDTLSTEKDGEPDFMHSDDEGRSWAFDRWVLTSEEVCFSEKFNPDGTPGIGQPKGNTCLGCGDFSIFTETEGAYIYFIIF